MLRVEAMGGRLDATAVFGLVAGWEFDAYLKRSSEWGLAYTAKDIYYAARYMREFGRTSDLPGRGVCGLLFRKPAGPPKNG